MPSPSRAACADAYFKVKRARHKIHRSVVRERILRFNATGRRWPYCLLLAGLLLLLPAPAWAWGPAAHLEFGLELLRDLTLLAPVVAALLDRFPIDFLYGNIAADITVGKNLAPYKLHCHNWKVGGSVLEMAADDAARAFAWGYLAHLAADVVAHNYYVPYKVVEHYRRRRAAHAYWEMRFDTWMSAESWKTVRDLSGRSFAAHDQHLRAILTGPLFSFGVNKQIFNSMVLFSQILRWKRTAEAYARSTRMALSAEEVEEMRRLSIERVRQLLVAGSDAACTRADPTGHRNLLIARDMRKRLRKLYIEGRLDDPETIGARFRPLFRSAIDAKLELPSLREMVDRQTQAVKPVSRKKPYRKPGSRSLARGLLGGRRKSNAVRETRKRRRLMKRARIAQALAIAREQKRAAKVAGKQERLSRDRKKIMARVKSRVLHEIKKFRRHPRGE